MGFGGHVDAHVGHVPHVRWPVVRRRGESGMLGEGERPTQNGRTDVEGMFYPLDLARTVERATASPSALSFKSVSFIESENFAEYFATYARSGPAPFEAW